MTFSQVMAEANARSIAQEQKAMEAQASRRELIKKEMIEINETFSKRGRARPPINSDASWARVEKRRAGK